MYGCAKEGMDDLFSFQGVLLFITCQSLVAYPNLITMYLSQTYMAHMSFQKLQTIIIWLGYGHFACPHFSCITTSRYELFQAIQVCIQERKDSNMVRNNHLELNKITLVGRVAQSIRPILVQTKHIKRVQGNKGLAIKSSGYG